MKEQYSQNFIKAYRQEIKRIVLKQGGFYFNRMYLKENAGSCEWTIEHNIKLLNTMEYKLYKTLDEAIIYMVEFILEDGKPNTNY